MGLPGKYERRFATVEAEGSMADFDQILKQVVQTGLESFPGAYLEDVKFQTVQIAGGKVRYSGIVMMVAEVS